MRSGSRILVSASILCLIIMAFAGCQSSMSRRERPRNSATSSFVGNVTVALAGIDTQQLPIPQRGLTLRSAISTAFDRAPGQLLERGHFAEGELRKLIGITEELRQTMVDAGIRDVQADDESFVLVRDGIHYFIPAFMVTNTELGGIRVLDGDEIASISSEVLFKSAQIAPKANTNPTAPLSFTVINNDGQQQNYTLSVGQLKQLALATPPTIGSIDDASRDYDDMWRMLKEPDGTPVRRLAQKGSQHLPNMFLVFRNSAAGIPCVFFFPSLLNFDLGDPFKPTPGRERFGNGNAIRNNVLEMGLLDGDVIQYTRPEQIPLVIDGIISPPADEQDMPSAAAPVAKKPGWRLGKLYICWGDDEDAATTTTTAAKEEGRRIEMRRR